MRLLSGLLFTLGLAAAQTLTLTGPASTQPGQTVPLTLTLAGATGKNISGLQWSTVPPTGLTVSSVTSGSMLGPVGKAVYCSANNQICLAIGLSSTNVITNNPATDGTVASIQVAVATNAPTGATPIPLSGLFAADTGALNVAITSGAPYSILILSKCDANGDGTVDYKDVQAVLNGIFTPAACPLTGGCTLQSLVAVLRAANGSACSL